jgi:type VI secretion system protein ImpL
LAQLGRQLKLLILISVLVALTGVAILLIIFLSDDLGVLQIALIAGLLLLWPIALLILYFRNRKKPAEPAKSDEPAAASLPESGAADELRRGAEEAVQWLRQSGVKQGADDPAYSLPWFMVTGPPSSGKTSLVLTSGLAFNALPSQRRSDQNLLRPTAGCDWRVTDDCVLLDTAGRYQLEGPDHGEWRALIDVLKKYRQQRLLDGMVITVSAEEILGLDESQIEQRAQILRERLNEVIKGAKTRFPVYLVFTKADALAGFSEFFGNFDSSERAQVWGATIPLDQANTSQALFDVEFNYLGDALERRRLVRLSSATTPHEQLGVFDFPARINEARQKLGQFTTVLFKPNPFSELPLFRGFYLTSSAGTALGSSGEGTERRLTDKGFFATDLFREVLLPDRYLAASYQASNAQPNRIRRLTAAAIAGGVLAALLLVAMGVAFVRNRGLVEDGQKAALAVLGHYEAAARTGADGDALSPTEVDDLNSLREVLGKLDDLNGSWFGSLFYRFGLYSGKKICPRLHEVYYEFVSQRLLGPAVGKLAQDLKTSPSKSGDPQAVEADQDKYFDKLKCYQMLERQDRVEPEFLGEQLGAYWAEPPSSRGRKDNLDFYVGEAFTHLDDYKHLPRPKADDAVVSQARESLKSYSQFKRVYNEIIADINKRGAPIDLPRVLQGQEGSEWIEEAAPHPVPYGFTKRAFYQHVQGESLLSAIERMNNKEDWVLGSQTASQGIKLSDLLDRYYSDYATHWKKFLDGIRIAKFDSKRKAVDVLTVFSQDNSPLKAIVREVSEQTRLSEPPASDGMVGWLKSRLVSRSGAVDPRIEKLFDPVIKFAGGPISQYLNGLGEVRKSLAGSSGDQWIQIASLETNADFRKAVDGTRDLVKPMKKTPGSTAVAELLERPLDGVETGLKGGVVSNVDDAWAQVWGTAQKLESRYPFNAASSAWVLIPDLSQYLNPASGSLSKFFDDQLKSSFDGSPGQFKPRNADDFSPAFVDYINAMFRVRDALYPAGSQQPKLSYSVTLQPPSGQPAEMILDGLDLKASGSPATATPSWPSAADNPGIKVLSGPAPGEVGGQPKELAHFDGPWGLFRMLGGRPGGAQYQMAWGDVRATIQPPANNPFQIDFTRLRAPKSLRK